MKTEYILMAVVAGLCYCIGDAIFKYKFQVHQEIGFLNFLRFWSLPAGVLGALILAYGLSAFGKMITLYPLKEVEFSAFLPMVIVICILLVSITGIIFFNERLTTYRAFGILAAISAIYLLNA
jgi:multidrug transporter EmrE-like cation transporter